METTKFTLRSFSQRLHGERKFGPIESRHESQVRTNFKVDKQKDKIEAQIESRT
jgi:hypothetical protein